MQEFFYKPHSRNKRGRITMNKSTLLNVTVFGLLATIASPAFAGVVVTPAPVAGLGLGAVVVIGIGYRALKRRINR